MGGVLKRLIFSCFAESYGVRVGAGSSVEAKDHCANSLNL